MCLAWHAPFWNDESMPLFSDRKSAAPDHMPPPSLPLLALELRAPWEFGAVPVSYTHLTLPTTPYV